MREILFRGKRVDNGEWIYWDRYGRITDINGKPTKTKIDIPTLYPYRTYIADLPIINDETVGDYTGLTDKNGKRIFEGDICGCFCNTQIFDVKYCEERCGYFFDDCVISGGCEPAPECLGNLRNTIEVIGTIYDNPELLEDEQ